MAQALGCWPLTAEVQVRFPANPSDICGAQKGTGIIFFSPEYSGLSLSHSTKASHSSSTSSYYQDTRTKPGNLRKGFLLQQSRRTSYKSTFTLSVSS